MSEEHRSHRLNARRGACGEDEARPLQWKRTIFQDITSAVAHHGAMREIRRFIRFAYNGSPAYGLLTNDAVEELKGPPFQSVEPTGRSFPLAAVTLLTPCESSKVLAVGLNYASNRRHVEKEEGIFVTVAGRPAPSDRPVVFAKGVSVADARSHVFGVTACNDLVDREWLLGDLQWFRAKGSDGFGPIGPAIVTGLDYESLELETRVNGQVRQSSHTSELVFSPDVLLSYISQYVTLVPGDVVFTGTPGQTQQVRKGDVIEVAIEHVGTLRNRVAG
jgi:2-keto-4-pentenoate hydratase/2-oxohepta-3-ene-1,7-dioic acid hydratase in catechol pathway